MWKNQNLRIFQGPSWSTDELDGFCETMGLGLLALQDIWVIAKLLIRNYGAFLIGCKLLLIVAFGKSSFEQTILKLLTLFMKEFVKFLILL
ncbi:hypothetical protein J1N35_041547 [Gossypium stocksii]|uniref:Uncharacterized protein n=1 Tax=Gossypium stocksii TaxID=47602 RepID=A0A9D3UG53_9ROSI|nr:hypothetical protein J1N35_041547 [Gossypium stocksii]